MADENQPAVFEEDTPPTPIHSQAPTMHAPPPHVPPAGVSPAYRGASPTHLPPPASSGPHPAYSGGQPSSTADDRARIAVLESTYRYCAETPPTLLELSTMEMTDDQGFEAYAVKWRAREAKHVPPISEAQQIQLFHYTLKGAYYLHLLAHTSSFSNLIDTRKKLDIGIKLGKIEGPAEKKEGESSKRAATGTAGNRRGKDTSVNAVNSGRQAPQQYSQYAHNYAPALPPIQQGKPPASRTPQLVQWAPAPQDQQGIATQMQRKQFTPLPAPLSHIYRQLLAGNKIRSIAPNPDFDLTIQDQSRRCEYHQGAPCHTTDNCWKLRERIQQMIDDKQLTFNAVKPPNVQSNTLPDHGSSSGPSINMIGVCAIGKYETGQEAPAPFVIEYVPAEIGVGYAGFDATLALFVIEVPAQEPYQDNKRHGRDALGSSLRKSKGRQQRESPGSTRSRPGSLVYSPEEDRLITVKGEEDYAIYKETAVPYISIGDDQNLPFYSFETISVIRDYGEISPTRADCMVGKILLRHNYIPGSGLGAHGQGINHPIEVKEYKNKRGLGFRHSCHEIIEARRGKHLHCLAARYGKINRGIPVQPLSYFFPGPPHIVGGTLDGLSSDSDNEPVDLPNICAVTEETTPGAYIRLAQENEELNNWTSVPRYSAVIADVLHSNLSLRRVDSNPSEELLEESRSIYFGKGLDEDGRVPEIEESLRSLENCQLTSVEPTEEINVFAWSYADMSSLDPSIVKHFLPLDTKRFPPKRQHLRRQRAGLLLRIKEEIIKQINAGFLEVCNYSEWVANIVPVEKKDGRVRVCVDYRDLNKASPKDNFPLPHIDVLVDNTARHTLFSFMDGFSEYNQIRMAEEDKIKTTFITMWGTFCYRVMPFGLKNARATYQRAMVTLFHNMMHKEIEVYVDDMIAKSKEGEDHLVNLKRLFDRLKKFIANLTDKCQPFFRLLRKNAAIEWDEECQKAFNTIKAYLAQPPVLVPPTPDRPLILYLTVRRQSLGCMLGQEDESTCAEHVIYYLSKKFTEGESNYPEIEKICCALVWVMQRLRQYTLYHTIRLLSKADPLKYLLDSPSSMKNISKWRCQLTEYDIEYVPHTSVKGQAIADHLAEFLIEDDTPINSNFPDEGILQVDSEENKFAWKMYFDGTVNSTGSGIGAVLISPDGRYYLIAAKVDFPCTNNVAEYEACILGLQAAIDFKKTKDAKLVPYHEYLEELAENFEEISFTYTPRIKNQFADALATLASMVSITKENLIEPLEIKIAKGPAHCNAIEATDEQPWYEDIKHFLQTGQYPTFANRRDRKTLRRLAAHYFMSRETLYCRSFDATLLRCVDEVEAQRLMGEIHERSCGPHMSGLMLAKKLMRLVTTNAVASFLKRDIIARYGVPETIITDNAKNLNNRIIDELCERFKVHHRNSTPYRPQMNGAVEAADKNIKKIIEKMTVPGGVPPSERMSVSFDKSQSLSGDSYSRIHCSSNFVSSFTVFRTSCPHLLHSGLRVHIYYFSNFASIFTAFRNLRPRTSCPSLLPFGLRVHLYCFSDFASIFTAFRTSRPSLFLFGLRVHGLCVHLYCFSNFASTDFVSIFTAFRTSRPRTSCPSLLLFGLRVHLYCFSNFPSTDFASIFTAFRTSRPSLLLFGLRIHGLRVHLYCFSDFAFIFIAFRTSRPSFTAFQTSCPHLQLFGLRVLICFFPDFVSVSTAFRTSYPHLLLSGLRVRICISDLVSTFTAFRTSCPHILLSGLRVRIHNFLDSVSSFASSRNSCPYLLFFGLRVLIYCFPDFVSASAFRTSCPHLRLSGLRVRIYCFPDFVSAFTTFWTPCPHLLLPGIHVRIYCFSDFVSSFTAFRTSCPHLHFGPRVHIYGFPDFVSVSTVFRTSCPHLLLSGLRVRICISDPVSTFTAFRTLCPHILLFGLRVLIYCIPDINCFPEIRAVRAGRARAGQGPSSARRLPTIPAGEVPIDHGEASAAPRAISRVHSGCRRGVQGRELPPPASSPPLPPISAALQLTGLGPFLFLCRLGPFRPNELQSDLASLPGDFSFGSTSPTRFVGDFFILQRSPSTFRTR
ncbi:hypothetical protein CRG98_040760 [Punica granatum]|uniref:Uncharacterized protein n=1 Tax=Punica granatum TaxID=22663 RepID=A0A2I0I5B5_PUNGR|nr:hypothetical protein CRG98_040760 [Punica granatum]